MFIPLLKNDKIKKTITVDSIKIGLEWLKGETRSYKKTDFKKFMVANYGYIKGTYTEEDDEEIDVYVGEGDIESNDVYKIDQLMSEYEAEKLNGKAFKDFDEEKYMLGFESEARAKSTYIKCMDKKLFGGITKMSWQQFKNIVNKNKKQLTKNIPALPFLAHNLNRA